MSPTSSSLLFNATRKNRSFVSRRVGKGTCRPSDLQVETHFIYSLNADDLLIHFSVNVIGDVILVVCPIIILWRIKLSSQRDRQMILVALSTNIITTLILSVTAIFGYGPAKKDTSYIILMYMLMHMATAFTLFSCNLLVVGSTIYRAVRASASLKSTTYTETEKAIPITLTELSLSQEPQIRMRFLHHSNQKPSRRHSVA
ncbi:hypothetical protein D9619_002205 [Psilocybe cf. subviscida]|uniref:Uncharacterized protein n=1 Tax=Psilocybe cf. subviscida TaxID=2480587 RepID=A0A8H5BFZ1_9AGAR|nr:hypothetical protein D9619_002205 [Psilocybe cf. subviscida]